MIGSRMISLIHLSIISITLIKVNSFERRLVPYEIHRMHDVSAIDEITGAYRPNYFEREEIPSQNCDDKSCKVEFQKELNLILRPSFGVKLEVTNPASDADLSIEVTVDKSTITSVMEFLYFHPYTKVVAGWAFENYDSSGYSDCKTNKEWVNQISASGEPIKILLDRGYLVKNSNFYLKSGSGGAFDDFTKACGHYWLSTLYMCIRKSTLVDTTHGLAVYKITDRSSVKATVCVKVAIGQKKCKEITFDLNEPQSIEMEENIKLEVKPIGDLITPKIGQYVVSELKINGDKATVLGWYVTANVPGLGSPTRVGLGSFQMTSISKTANLNMDPSWIEFDNVVVPCESLRAARSPKPWESPLANLIRVVRGASTPADEVIRPLGVNTTSSSQIEERHMTVRGCDMCDCCVKISSPSADQIRLPIQNMRPIEVEFGDIDPIVPKQISLSSGSFPELNIDFHQSRGPAAQATLMAKDVTVKFVDGEGKVLSLNVTEYVIVQGASGSLVTISMEYVGTSGNLLLTSNNVVIMTPQFFIQGSSTYKNTFSIKSPNTIPTSTRFCIMNKCVDKSPILVDPPEGGTDDPETNSSGSSFEIRSFWQLFHANTMVTICIILLWSLDVIFLILTFVISSKSIRVLILAIIIKCKGADAFSVNQGDVLYPREYNLALYMDEHTGPMSDWFPIDTLLGKESDEWVLMDFTNYESFVKEDDALFDSIRQGKAGTKLMIKMSESGTANVNFYLPLPQLNHTNGYHVYPDPITRTRTLPITKVKIPDNLHGSCKTHMVRSRLLQYCVSSNDHTNNVTTKVYVTQGLPFKDNPPIELIYDIERPKWSDSIAILHGYVSHTSVGSNTELRRAVIIRLLGLAGMNPDQWDVTYTGDALPVDIIQLRDHDSDQYMTRQRRTYINRGRRDVKAGNIGKQIKRMPIVEYQASEEAPMVDLSEPAPIPVLLQVSLFCTCKSQCDVEKMYKDTGARFIRDRVHSRFVGYKSFHESKRTVSRQLDDDIFIKDGKEYKPTIGRGVDLECDNAGVGMRLCRYDGGYLLSKKVEVPKKEEFRMISFSGKAMQVSVTRTKIKAYPYGNPPTGELFVNNKGFIICSSDSCDISSDNWRSMTRLGPGQLMKIPSARRKMNEIHRLNTFANLITGGEYESYRTKKMIAWKSSDIDHSIPVSEPNYCKSTRFNQVWECFADEYLVEYVFTCYGSLILIMIVVILWILRVSVQSCFKRKRRIQPEGEGLLRKLYKKTSAFTDYISGDIEEQNYTTTSRDKKVKMDRYMRMLSKRD